MNTLAEQHLLGCILVEGDLIKEVSLSPEHFYEARNRIIFKAMRELEKRNVPVDLVTVAQEIGTEMLEKIGGMEYLGALPGSVATTSIFDTYERLVLDGWKLRKAQEIANRITEEAPAGDASIISESISALSRLEEVGYEDDFNMVEVLDEIDDDIERATGELTGIDTGFEDLNKYTGGLQDEDLIIVGARPSMGKTAFALNLAKNAAVRGVMVTIFSLEMSKKMLIKRLMCAEGWIDASKMKNPKALFNDRDWGRLREAKATIAEMPLVIYDKPSTTVQEIRAKVRKRKRQYPDRKHLVIIDYLQLIMPTSRAESRNQELGEISRSLKLIAREMKLPVVALSQLSRSVESRSDKRPQMSDLRESGSIEQDADVVMFLYRDEYYNEESEKKNIAEVIIGKQRNGPTGKIELVFFNQFQRFESIALENLITR